MPRLTIEQGQRLNQLLEDKEIRDAINFIMRMGITVGMLETCYDPDLRPNKLFQMYWDQRPAKGK